MKPFTATVKELKSVIKGNKNILKHDNKRIVYVSSLKITAIGSDFTFSINFECNHSLEDGFYYLSTLNLKSQPIENDKEYLYFYNCLNQFNTSDEYDFYHGNDYFFNLQVANDIAVLHDKNSFMQINFKNSSKAEKQYSIYGVSPYTLYGIDGVTKFDFSARIPNIDLDLDKLETRYESISVRYHKNTNYPFIAFQSFSYEYCTHINGRFHEVGYFSLKSILSDIDCYDTKLNCDACYYSKYTDRYIAISNKGSIFLDDEFNYTGNKLYQFNGIIDSDDIYIFDLKILFPYRNKLGLTLSLNKDVKCRSMLQNKEYKLLGAIMPIDPRSKLDTVKQAIDRELSVNRRWSSVSNC